MANSAGLNYEFLQSLEELEPREEVDLLAGLPTLVNTKQDVRSIQELLKRVAQLEKMNKEQGTARWFVKPYSIDTLPKHKAFFDASAQYNEVLFLAGNRTGKSICGAYALSCHLTGVYPDWWEGRRFDSPISAWAVGKDARAVRDTLQKELLGGVGEWGTGMLPAHTLGKAFALQGTPQAIDIVKVRHVTGGWSELGFKNYQQDIGSFMGTSKDVVLCDEEVPIEIYNECNIRTATTKGLMLLTFTPLDGLTRLIVNFCKRADFLVGERPLVAMDQDIEEEGEEVVGFATSKAVVQAGWDDVPWLDAETKARLLEDTPEHLKEARSKGLPSQASGNVYQTAVEQVMCKPIEIPDNWPRMYGLDVGWNQTAAVWAALDPNTDTIYVYDEHYLAKELPSTHAYSIISRGKWIPGAFDPAARGRSPNDGRRLIQDYRDMGLNLYPAINEVDSGILAIQQRCAVKKLRIFSTCNNLLKEYMLYRRDKHGKIVKENDHALDALRYVVNNLKRMASKSDEDASVKLTYTPTRYDI